MLDGVMNTTRTVPLTEPIPVIRTQAPVLVIPDVLDKSQCDTLIRHWERGERTDGKVSSSRRGQQITDYAVKQREDVPIPDDHPLARNIAEIVSRKIAPEIAKAFQFRVSRMETLRIGRYDASNGGYFRPHRDNTTPYTLHRRFAMSLNLNTGDYDGGYLHFPEYRNAFYGMERGGAAVFSCSLLHEATDVTAGRRFGLFSFFCGEPDENLRAAMAARREAGGPTVRPPIPYSKDQAAAPARLSPSSDAGSSAAFGSTTPLKLSAAP